MAKVKDGTLLTKQEVVLDQATIREMKQVVHPAVDRKGIDAKQLLKIRQIGKRVRLFRIVYQSNGHRVNGFLCEPRVRRGKLPCIIWNRGGIGEFGSIKTDKAFRFLGKVADWGYIVIASQYSGNGGSEGMDDGGGLATVKDVLNLKTVLSGWQGADTKRIGMRGGSRGGMMTYLCLAKIRWLKAAVVVAGLADVRRNYSDRPEVRETWGKFGVRSKHDLQVRSAVCWPERFSKRTPILMMHGSADWRVSPLESLDLSSLLLKNKVPHRLVMFEGDDHGLTEHPEERDRLSREWFDRFVKKSSSLPNLKPHGF